MKLITIENESSNISYRKVNDDFLIKLKTTSKTIVDLEDPILNKAWVLNLDDVQGQITINVKSSLSQNILIYLNGSKKLSVEINLPNDLDKTGIIVISENNLLDENISLTLNLKRNSSVETTTLINAFQKSKIINWKINHFEENSHSLARSIGVNNKGTLKHMVNTVVKAPKGGCRQKLKIINFGNEANSECDPVLTIENNDIEYASHGATIGTFEQEHLFYLQSKGLKEMQAKKLLLNSNVIELLSCILDEKEQSFIANQYLFKVFSKNDEYQRSKK